MSCNPHFQHKLVDGSPSLAVDCRGNIMGGNLASLQFSVFVCEQIAYWFLPRLRGVQITPECNWTSKQLIAFSSSCDSASEQLRWCQISCHPMFDKIDWVQKIVRSYNEMIYVWTLNFNTLYINTAQKNMYLSNCLSCLIGWFPLNTHCTTQYWTATDQQHDRKKAAL